MPIERDTSAGRPASWQAQHGPHVEQAVGLAGQESDPSSRWIASGGATEAQRRVSGLRQAAPASGCWTGFGRWLAGLIGGL